MISPEIQKKICLLQLLVKKRLNGFLTGEYRSAHKGYGLEFDQLRDYQLGDDIRFMDWKSTGRLNKMVIKEYIHEHTRTILVAIDISASTIFSSQKELKKEIIQQVATVLALAGEYSKAYVGLLLFSDHIELYIPPKAGKSHINVIIQKIWSHTPNARGTNIKMVFDFLAQKSKKDTLLFFISDFINPMHKKELVLVSERYDMVIIRCLDKYEKAIAPIGYIHVQDPEHEGRFLLNLKNNREINNFLEQRIKKQDSQFKKSGIDFFDISLNFSYIDKLISFFARRLLH